MDLLYSLSVDGQPVRAYFDPHMANIKHDFILILAFSAVCSCVLCGIGCSSFQLKSLVTKAVHSSLMKAPNLCY